MSVPDHEDDYEPEYSDADPAMEEQEETATAVADRPPPRPLPFLGQRATPWQGEDQRRFDPASRRPDARDRSQWLSYVFLVIVLAGLGVAAWWFWDDIRGYLGFPQKPAPAHVDPGLRTKKNPRPQTVKTGTNSAKAFEAAKYKLKQIALALNAYVDKNGHLPPASINKNLSWRVALLPYLGHEDLYKQFNLNEPWNGATNILLRSKMPDVFAPVGGGVNNETFYQVFTGPNTLFDGETHNLKFKDPSSVTMLVVEARKSVIWTAPEDIAFDPGTDPQLGAQFPDVFLAVFADRTVHALPRTLKRQVLNAYVTPNGGEDVNLPDTFAIVPSAKKGP
jgi:uncharacterized protein DUF1559